LHSSHDFSGFSAQSNPPAGDRPLLFVFGIVCFKEGLNISSQPFKLFVRRKELEVSK
jgi:hypothetical protein